MAVVVQPGVDFDSNNVFPFDSAKIVELRDSLNNKKDVFFEAHSTDYQSTEALRELVVNKCIFLKVGPALTFAYREALFGLSQVARYFDIPSHVAHLDSVMFEHMKKDPTHWTPYYKKDDELTLLYSLSDRIRYYWDTKEVAQEVEELIEKMSAFTLPVGLVAQYFPRLGGIENIVKNIKRLHPRDIIMSSIDAELERYEIACSPDRNITHEDN
jgi:D-tagatose-1,6-bisphosphate aldolase subunit GatZ/KbaZ